MADVRLAATGHDETVLTAGRVAVALPWSVPRHLAYDHIELDQARVSMLRPRTARRTSRTATRPRTRCARLETGHSQSPLRGLDFRMRR